MRIYYFGCMEGVGHYLHTPPNNSTNQRMSGLPWRDIDATLCLDYNSRRTSKQDEGTAIVHKKDGWTALAFWDRSIDHRNNSNSVFFYENLLDFGQMIEAFKEHFPCVFNRFKFPITEFNPEG